MLLAVFCLLPPSATALAQSTLSPGYDTDNLTVSVRHTPARNDVAEELSQTRIEADAESGEIRFIINGKTAATLTENGLFVDGDVNGHAFLHGAHAGEEETGSDQPRKNHEEDAP